MLMAQQLLLTTWEVINMIDQARQIISQNNGISVHQLTAKLNASGIQATGPFVCSLGCALTGGICNPGEYPNWSHVRNKFYYTAVAPTSGE